MRIPVALAFVLALAPAARADCPPDCVAGGGPSATDCFIAWSGLPGMSETCADGEACDLDGKVDGICTLGLQGCINVPGLGACTPAGLGLPLKLSLAGISPGKAHFTVTASSSGKRDRDKLRLTCTPGAAQI